jgi:hypothetical protein
MEQIECIANWVTIFGLPLAIFTLVLGMINIRQSKIIEQGKFLIELRKMFPEHDNIHFKFRPEGEWRTGQIPNDNETWAKIDAYLGLFELCEILIENNSLSEVHFKAQYEYRLRNILANNQVRTLKLEQEQEFGLTL